MGRTVPGGRGFRPGDLHHRTFRPANGRRLSPWGGQIRLIGRNVNQFGKGRREAERCGSAKGLRPGRPVPPAPVSFPSRLQACAGKGYAGAGGAQCGTACQASRYCRGRRGSCGYGGSGPSHWPGDAAPSSDNTGYRYSRHGAAATRAPLPRWHGRSRRARTASETRQTCKAQRFSAHPSCQAASRSGHRHYSRPLRAAGRSGSPARWR